MRDEKGRFLKGSNNFTEKRDGIQVFETKKSQTEVSPLENQINDQVGLDFDKIRVGFGEILDRFFLNTVSLQLLINSLSNKELNKDRGYYNQLKREMIDALIGVIKI
jgi:hypothetical protein